MFKKLKCIMNKWFIVGTPTVRNSTQNPHPKIGKIMIFLTSNSGACVITCAPHIANFEISNWNFLTNIINIEILPNSIFWRVLITHGHALCIFSEFQKKKDVSLNFAKIGKIFKYDIWIFLMKISRLYLCYMILALRQKKESIV